MSIKYRVIILLASIAIIYVLITSMVLRTQVLPAFLELERDFVSQDAKRVEQYINAELQRLDYFVKDWASWDETYDYLRGINPDFEASSLTWDAATVIQVNFLLFLDTEAKLVWNNAYHLDTKAELSLEHYLEMPLAATPEVFLLRSATDSSLGILNGTGPPLLYSSRPILNNESEGPAVGMVVAATIIDDYFLSQLKDQLALDIQIWDLNGSLPAEVQQAQAKLVTGSGGVVWIESDSHLRHFQQVNDIYGEPSILIQLSSPRRILGIGSDTIGAAIAVLVAASALFMLVIWFFLDTLIVAPVKQLQTHINKMQKDEDLTRPINMSRTDEFGDVAREFNALTGKLLDSRRELEAAKMAALAASESKSSYLAIMSHEIRTPMNGVLGMVDLLLRTPSLSAEQKHYAGIISQSGSALLGILNDILDLSKIEVGKFTLEQKEFQLSTALENSIESIGYEAHRKGLGLILDAPPELHDLYLGDAGRLYQLLLNLLSNAVKFTQSGQVILKAKTDNSADDEVFVLFEVIDTGIGVRQENQANLFTPFTQEDASTTRRFGGTGLGLAVTRQLAELMGGEAGFSSVYGRGSTFWFRIPLQLLEYESHSQPMQFRGSHAVLYMGEKADEQVLIRQLEYWGLCVHSTKNTSELKSCIDRSVTLESALPVSLLIDKDCLRDEVQHSIKRLLASYGKEQLRIIVQCPISESLDASELLDLRAPIVMYKPLRIGPLAECWHNAAEEVEFESNASPVLLPGDEAVSTRPALLVEDNSVNVMVAKAMLNKLSYEVTTASNGQEAVAFCSNKNFDVVLMDCAMPEMDGFEATRIIRVAETENNSDKATIIALTANVMNEDRERCQDAGMDGFLSKPISLNALAEVLPR